MLPYPTDRRRLLMMVRVFVHEFAELVAARSDGWVDAASADRQLEAFLERLAVDAEQADAASERTQTEGEIQRDLAQGLVELLQHAGWSRRRIGWN